jgi:hypothetical protein
LQADDLQTTPKNIELEFIMRLISCPRNLALQQKLSSLKVFHADKKKGLVSP